MSDETIGGYRTPATKEEEPPLTFRGKAEIAAWEKCMANLVGSGYILVNSLNDAMRVADAVILGRRLRNPNGW